MVHHHLSSEHSGVKLEFFFKMPLSGKGKPYRPLETSALVDPEFLPEIFNPVDGAVPKISKKVNNAPKDPNAGDIAAHRQYQQLMTQHTVDGIGPPRSLPVGNNQQIYSQPPGTLNDPYAFSTMGSYQAYSDDEDDEQQQQQQGVMNQQARNHPYPTRGRKQGRKQPQYEEYEEYADDEYEMPVKAPKGRRRKLPMQNPVDEEFEEFKRMKQLQKMGKKMRVRKRDVDPMEDMMEGGGGSQLTADDPAKFIQSCNRYGLMIKDGRPENILKMNNGQLNDLVSICKCIDQGAMGDESDLSRSFTKAQRQTIKAISHSDDAISKRGSLCDGQLLKKLSNFLLDLEEHDE
jgi:hypothetical protein